MLGRVRPSSLDCLERPPPKIIKDDALSIYEATLTKLRLGSRRALLSSSTNSMDIDVSSQRADSRYSNGPSVDCSKQRKEQDFNSLSVA